MFHAEYNEVLKNGKSLRQFIAVSNSESIFKIGKLLQKV